jgi:hypothetical protein
VLVPGKHNKDIGQVKVRPVPPCPRSIGKRPIARGMQENINWIKVLSGVPGEIRTHGPKIRNLVLYPAELRGQPVPIIPQSAIRAKPLPRETALAATEMIHNTLRPNP